jgi:DNA-binding MarR family transcriptional regulator/N-acetylglutamate synthase-like GNAT family acetyltransferase
MENSSRRKTNPLARAALPPRVEAVRRFNRFYTRQIGVLPEKLLRSPFSLAEARVIYELAHHERTTATDLAGELGLDGGYLSRILNGFRKRGLIAKQPSPTDGRQTILWLTKQGQEAFATINARSRNQIEAMLNGLSASDQKRLIEVMDTIEKLLGARPERRVPYLLRPHQPGDMGWVVHRHGVLYAEEYGWNEQFEALVAGIAAKFIQHYDPKKERCWIAEKEGEVVGSVFLVKKSKAVAKLRLLLVEPKARGLGIGTRLVDECTRFARHAGYRKIVLWTNSILHAARHIYEEKGYHLVRRESHHSFGHDLIGETWELKL